ncbi:MAG: YbaK/EbsC family protein [Gammaproteobacteria bacterium]
MVYDHHHTQTREALMELPGVEPGAVTPFGVMSDQDKNVASFLDKSIIKTPTINAHPLRNDMTTTLDINDLLRFMNAENHCPVLIDFDQGS